MLFRRDRSRSWHGYDEKTYPPDLLTKLDLARCWLFGTTATASYSRSRNLYHTYVGASSKIALLYRLTSSSFLDGRLSVLHPVSTAPCADACFQQGEAKEEVINHEQTSLHGQVFAILSRDYHESPQSWQIASTFKSCLDCIFAHATASVSLDGSWSCPTIDSSESTDIGI